MLLVMFVFGSVMSVVFENVATGPNDGEIKAVTSKKITNKKPRELNLSEGDKIIVKIVAKMDEFGFDSSMEKTFKDKNPKKSNSFYAIATIKEVERWCSPGVGLHSFLVHPQPTIQPIEIELKDGRKIIIRATDKDKDKEVMSNVNRRYDLRGISESHLVSKTANESNSHKMNRPYHTTVIVNGEKEALKSFVFVHFSGMKEMTNKMLQDQENAVNDWFQKYILACKPLFDKHMRIMTDRVEQEEKQKEEERRREADPEFQRKQKEYWDNWYKNQYGSRSTASTSTAPNGKVDEWSTACSGVSEFDTHLKTLGINRETDAATRHLFGQMKKEKALLVHPDRCPTSFETATQEQKKWFKRTFGGNVKEKPESKEECDDYMKRVNNATDQISNCALK